MKKYLVLPCLLLVAMSDVFAETSGLEVASPAADRRSLTNEEIEAKIEAREAGEKLGHQLIRNLFKKKATDSIIAKINDDAAIALIERGADLTVVDFTFGFTPLHCAVFFGRLQVVKKLIENGANLFAQTQARDGVGHTPLHLAFQLNLLDEAVELVLANKKTITTKNRIGEVPLQLLLDRGVNQELFVAKLNAEKRRREVLEGSVR